MAANAITINNPSTNQTFPATQTSLSVQAVVVPGTAGLSKTTLSMNGGAEANMVVDNSKPNGHKLFVGMQAGTNTATVRAYTTAGVVDATQTVTFNNGGGGGGGNPPPASPQVNIDAPAPDGIILVVTATTISATVASAAGIDPTSVQVSLDQLTWKTMSPALGGGG